MHRQDQLSSTHEMYLKVLYRLREEHEVARVRDMAKGLGVSPGTVSAVLKKLENHGYVNHDRYGAATLTKKGEEIAECVVRRYENIHALLTEVLGLDLDTAETDACMMEHAVSPATINRIEQLVTLVRDGRLDITVMQQTPPRPATGQCDECKAMSACQTELNAGRSASSDA